MTKTEISSKARTFVVNCLWKAANKLRRDKPPFTYWTVRARFSDGPCDSYSEMFTSKDVAFLYGHFQAEQGAISVEIRPIKPT